MLFLPVLRSKLGVLRHLEHLADSRGELRPKEDDPELSVSKESHASSLVTWTTFCWSGRGLGLAGVRLRAGDFGVCIHVWLAIIDGVVGLQVVGDVFEAQRASRKATISMGDGAVGVA